MSNSKNGNFDCNNNESDNLGRELSSKFQVSKNNKRKSFIPLLKPNTKSQCAPIIPQTTPIMAASKSAVWAFRRNYRSIHSSSIPYKNDILTDEELVAANPSEGSLIATSKVSSNKSSQFFLEWKNDSVSFQIEGDSKIDKLHPQTYLQQTCTPKEERQLKPMHWMVRLAIKSSETAQRTRAYFLCPICNEPFSRPAIIACGHMHCMQCVRNWFEDQDSCPCCRYRIILKDANDALTAKDFFESSFLLASIFSAGNFYVNLMQSRKLSINALELDSSSTESVFNCPSQQLMSQFISSTFKKILQQENSLTNKTGDDKNNGDCIIESHCFKAAIWFLRHGLQVANLENFHELLRLEMQQGSDDNSKEVFLKRIMTMKKPKNGNDNSANFTIPHSSLIESSRKNSINGHDRQPRLRFRMPSTQGLGKILLTSFIFIVISLAVHLMDNNSRLKNTQSDKANFYKMDFFVYFVIIFSMATYTETERIIFRRLQRMGVNYNGNRRRRRW